MRKTIVTLVALCAAMTANATILRVSNVNGSTAPYSTIQAAHDAASEGDTIMVDGSDTEYEMAVIKQRVVIIGPGYWINENGLVQEAAPSAATQLEIRSTAVGTVVEGLSFNKNLNWGIKINADNCIVRRCNFYHGASNRAIVFGRDDSEDRTPDPKGGVIHQNFFYDSKIETTNTKAAMTNVQITNNIFVNDIPEPHINNFVASYMAYNTMLSSIKYGTTGATAFRNVYASTIEHNIIRLSKDLENKYIKLSWSSVSDDNNEWNDNYETLPFDISYKTDKDICDLESLIDQSSIYGAFAGDSPYVISGIPAAPVIQDLVVPTTIEAGNKMKVTIKLGIQK